MRVIVAVVGLFAVATLGLASIAQAASPVVVGSYTFVDLDQGGWASGPLFADGTVGGGGAFSFDNGQNVGTITATSWTMLGPGAILICFTDTNTKGTVPLFPSPLCAPLPVGKPTKISLGPGETSLIRVHLNQ